MFGPRNPTEEGQARVMDQTAICPLDQEPLWSHARCDCTLLVGPEHEVLEAPCPTCAYYRVVAL